MIHPKYKGEHAYEFGEDAQNMARSISAGIAGGVAAVVVAPKSPTGRRVHQDKFYARCCLGIGAEIYVIKVGRSFKYGCGRNGVSARGETPYLAFTAWLDGQREAVVK